jgi:hypothetical protein
MPPEQTAPAPQKPAAPAPQTPVVQAPAAPEINLGVHDVSRIPVHPDAPPAASPLPEARTIVAQTAYQRQLAANRRPAPRKHRFSVSVGEEAPRVVIADNENDAWAMYCDAKQSWPSPRMTDRKIKDLGPVPQEE